MYEPKMSKSEKNFGTLKTLNFAIYRKLLLLLFIINKEYCFFFIFTPAMVMMIKRCGFSAVAFFSGY